MKKIVEKVRKAIPQIIEDYTAEDAGSFDFIERKTEIMKELDFCKRSGTLVGVYSRKMGPGLFLVGVADIVYDIKSELIIFHPRDMGGYTLPCNEVLLDEIDKIIPFNNRYIRPGISIPSEIMAVNRYISRNSERLTA